MNTAGQSLHPSLPRRRLTRWWTDRPLQQKGITVVALPLMIYLGAVVTLYRANAALAAADREVAITIAIQTNVHAVHALVAEAASGVRGSLLTGDATLRTPVQNAEKEVPQLLRRLRTLMRDPEATRRLDTLAGLVTRHEQALRAVAVVGVLSSVSETEAARLREALRESQTVLDAMRGEIERIQAREAVLLQARQDRADAVRRRMLQLTALLTLLGMTGSVVAVVLFSSGIVARVRVLRERASQLGRGEPLGALPDAADEIGELGENMREASALLRAREQALREGEERFRMVVDGVRDYGIFALDVDGGVASWNAGAERIKGWQADEIIGRHFSAFYPEEERAWRPARNLNDARRHGRAEDEGWRVRKDGTRFWANVVITPLRNDDGVLRGFSKVTRDITDRRLQEDAVQQARREAEAASAAKSEFLSRMSHELRTPLNAVLGFAQLLDLDGAQRTADDREAISHILRAGRHLLGLIDEVLDIARIESGRVDLSLEAVRVDELVDEAVALTRLQAEAAQVTVRTDGSSPMFVMADRRRLLQVLLNLLSNGIKFNEAGGSVTVHAEQREADVRLIVRDDGIGIEPELAAELFTPFRRVGRGAATREGTGLGLALSRRLLATMGGDLRLIPALDGESGAAFELTLPGPTTVSEAPAPRIDSVSSAVQPLPEQPTVLLVEDHLANVRLMEQVVARAWPGARLICAMQATLGVELARQHAPQVALIDLHLPDRPGTWVLSQLAALPKPPIAFLLTADVAAPLSAVQPGPAVAVFVKPFDVSQLVSALRHHLHATRT